MAKINIYFDELNEDARNEIWEAVREELKNEIQEMKEDNPEIGPETIEHEVIDDYINCHNFANELIV